MIELKNVTKTYGNVEAVKDVSFVVKPGEILGFLGPNGAGKTTTMKMITCYMPPTSGTILVDGLDVQEHSLEVRKKIGYLPENTPLYDEMGVREYLDFIADVRGIPKDQRRRVMDEVITECGLEEVIQMDIGELSKGYRQRVGLAQAIMHNPDFLVLDEPTTGLDPNQIVEIRKLIKQLGREKTVIFSTHIMQEVQAVCDRVLIINQGRIAAQGTPEELEASVRGQQVLHVVVKGAEANEVADAFRTLGGVEVKKVEPVNATVRADLATDGNKDIREELFDLVVSKQWKLLELSLTRLSLEDVFRKLTGKGE